VQQQFTIPVVPSGNLMLTNDDTICAGVSILLTASGNYPGQFQWSNGQTGQVISITPSQSSTYTVQYTYPAPSLQCISIDSVEITVLGEVAEVQFPADTLLCPGEGVILNSVATPGATYVWSSTPGNFTSNDPTPGIIFPQESTTFQVLTTLNGCVKTYEVDITVYNPQVTVSNDTAICLGESVMIMADAFLTGDYSWLPGGTDPSFLATPMQTTMYDLLFLYGNGCIYEDSVLVTIVPNFTIKLVTDPDTNRVDAGATIFLDAFIPGTNASNYSFEWQENADIIGNTQQITVTPVTMSDSVTYVVTVVSPSGCVQTESVTFAIIKPDVQFPNAFTPNGDGANDGFGLAIVEGIASVESLEIYNRWGQKVFSSMEPGARWDGQVNGQPAPSDVYVYVVFWRGGDGALKFQKGEVTLLR
jgi:gliding motility-associated-like protein